MAVESGSDVSFSWTWAAVSPFTRRGSPVVRHRGSAGPRGVRSWAVAVGGTAGARTVQDVPTCRAAGPDPGCVGNHCAVTVDRWLTVIFGVVGVLALLVAWRWRPRKTRLLFTWEGTRLLPRVAASELIEVTFRGIPVQNPHVVRVTLSNPGPRDISADQFDRGAALEIHHGAVLLGVVATDGDPSLTIPALGSSDPLRLNPALLKAGETWAVDAVVEGPPSMSVRGRLANVVLEERTRSDVLQLAASATSETLIEILVNGLAAAIQSLSALLFGPRRRR